MVPPILAHTESILKSIYTFPFNNKTIADPRHVNQKQVVKKIKAKMKAKLSSVASLNSSALSHSIPNAPSTIISDGSKWPKSKHLDISYITPKLIVGSYPVTKYPKQLYRVSLVDLVQFLNNYHGTNNWKIFNLKAEICESDYSDPQFNEIVQKTLPKNHKNQSSFPSLALLSRCGWLDHEVPPFGHLQTILKSISVAMGTNDASAVFLHCKMGKGRSGLVTTAYLMSQSSVTKEKALDMFEKARFKSGAIKGVIIKSQLRWLNYQGFYLQLDPIEQGIVYSSLTNGITENEKSCAFEITKICIENPFDLLVDFLNTQKIMDWAMFIEFQTYNDQLNGYVTLFQCEFNPKHFGNTKRLTTTASSRDKPRKQGEFEFQENPSSNGSQYLTITLREPLPRGVSDIRVNLSFKSMKKNSLLNHFPLLNSSVHFWYNLYLETLLCSTKTHCRSFCQFETLKREQEQCFLNVGMGYFQVSWANLDGYKGTTAKGIKLFDSIDIHWSLI